MRLGKRIRDMRRWAGMSQETLGRKLDVTRKTIGVYERGDAPRTLESASFWKELAKGLSSEDFEVTVEMLLVDLLPNA